VALNDIIAILNTGRIDLAGEVITNSSTANSIFVPVKINRDKNGKQEPSYYTLSKLKNDLASIGYTAEFLLIDKFADSIENGLRLSLVTAFPQFVRNVFVTVTNGIATIWLDNKRAILDAEDAAIRTYIEQYILATFLASAEIYLISQEAIATNTEILAILRKFSPSNCENLSLHLVERGFSVPSADWVNRKLDALRKAGLLVRFSNRTYALTSDALHKLGTRKDRHSPDVSRLLALARGLG
jgi:hypothetical protein